MSTHYPPYSQLALTPDYSCLNRERHIKYWLRCLKTYLPAAYQSNDCQRMTLAFFILSALDILGALHSCTTPAERAEYVEWILRCQHPQGGFRGFTGTMAGDVSGVPDSANLAATYFACAALIVLGEGLERVMRRQCLEWMRRLQREDGSFGEGFGRGGLVEGGEDMRFCYLAAGVRWMLRRGVMEETGDIDVDGVVRYIRASVVSEHWLNF